MSKRRKDESGPDDLEILQSFRETLGRMPGGEQLFEELGRRAQTASSADEFLGEIFGGEDIVRDLLDETRDWGLDRHQARVDEIRTEAAELDEKDADDLVLSVDLEYAREFHEQAIELLRDRGLATLAEAGDVEAAVAELMRRLRAAGGMYAPADPSDEE